MEQQVIKPSKYYSRKPERRFEPGSKDFAVSTFYKFVHLKELDNWKANFITRMTELEIKGTILLAEEGINSTISGKPSNVLDFIKYLKSFPEFSDLEHKESFTSEYPFHRVKVKIKPEIVKLEEEVDPTCYVGKYVEAKDWNSFLTDPEVVTIDTRNDYEVQMGTFENAINPNTENFTEIKEFTDKVLKQNKPKKIAMFCTGGIRCEKYSSYLLSQGFDEIYHLKGGILKYLEEIPAEDSLWKGNCFVFDDRRIVNHEDFQ